MPSRDEVNAAHIARYQAEEKYGTGSPEQEVYELIADTKAAQYQQETGRKFGAREG